MCAMLHESNVPCRLTVAALCHTPPKVLKVDGEGFETKVLRGARRLMERRAIWFLLVGE